MKKFPYIVLDQDRLFCYAWYEKGNENETKFGQRWVKSGEDPTDSCAKRVRNSLGVRKDIYDNGDVVLCEIWDVSEYSKKHNMFDKKAKVDDKIRKSIGFVKQGEVHNLHYEKLVEKVNNILRKENQPRPIVALSTPQYTTVRDLRDHFLDGNSVIMAELCARFGKTIFSSALSVELSPDVTIICSYVMTVFTSFKNDVQAFHQFQHIEHVDTSEDDYQQQIDEHLSNGKKVFVYLSLCNGRKRKERLEFLSSLTQSKFWIIDEADFGAHQKNQFEPLRDATKEDDKVLVMTGTNSDRAVSGWGVEYMTSTTYFELLVHKQSTKEGYDGGLSGLKHFKENVGRNLLFPSVKCYQMDLKTIVDYSINNGLVPDMDELPSWNKVAANPVRAKGFLGAMFESIFKGRNSMDEYNVDFQTERYSAKDGVMSMVFFPDNTRVENLMMIGDILQSSLGDGFFIVTLCGDTVKDNSECEDKVKRAIEEYPNRQIIIIASKMAQRSFSIGGIEDLYLAYDRGQDGSTIQKMSRALTPDGKEKVANIISLSFDPNRDDKIDALVLQAALNQVEKKTVKDIREALRLVLRSIDVISCTPDGSVRINPDDFVEEALMKDGVSRILGKMANIHILSDDELDALAKCDVKRMKELREVAETGKTTNTNDEKNNATSKIENIELTPKEKQTNIKKVREAVNNIIDHSDILMSVGKYFGAINIQEVLSVIVSEGLEDEVAEEYGIDFYMICVIFERGIIKQSWINLIHGEFQKDVKEETYVG